MLLLSDIKKQAEQFRAKKKADVVYIPEESRPFHEFHARGVLTVRYVNGDDWKKVGEDMVANPDAYLYLDEWSVAGSRKLYPKKPKMLTHKDRMEALFESVSADDEKVYTFVVGQEQTKFKVHSSIVKSMLQVPLLNDHMMEAVSKTVILPDDSVAPFEVFVKFLYKLEVSEKDMWKHCYGLLRLANKYCVEMLHFMCEWYLCWRVQVVIVTPLRRVYVSQPRDNPLTAPFGRTSRP